MVLQIGGIQEDFLVLTAVIEAAVSAGNALARHHIVPSRDFERLMDNLHQAAETLDRIAVEREASVVIPFPKRDSPSVSTTRRLSTRSVKNSLSTTLCPTVSGD